MITKCTKKFVLLPCTVFITLYTVITFKELHKLTTFLDFKINLSVLGILYTTTRPTHSPPLQSDDLRLSYVMRKQAFRLCETKTQISCTAQLISSFVFTSRIAQSLFFLSKKFQASCLLVYCRCVTVVPCRNPPKLVLSCSHLNSPINVSLERNTLSMLK